MGAEDNSETEADPMLKPHIIEISNDDEKEKKEEIKAPMDYRLYQAIYDLESVETIKALVDKNPDLVYVAVDKEGLPYVTKLAKKFEKYWEWTVEVAKILMGVQEIEGEEERDKIKVVKIERPNLFFKPPPAANPLYEVAYWGNALLFKALLRWGGEEWLEENNAHSAVIFEVMEGAMGGNENYEQDACELLKIVLVLPACTKEDVNAPSKTDEAEYNGCYLTPVQKAAAEGLSKILLVLIQHEDTNVLHNDMKGASALHHAAWQDYARNYDGGFKCVSLLLEWIATEENKGDYDIIPKQFFEDKSEEGKTAFELMCSTYPGTYIQRLVAGSGDERKDKTLLPLPSEIWATDYNMTVLYKHCPTALEPIMNSAFAYREGKRGKSRDGRNYVDVDFGIITGYPCFASEQENAKNKSETKYLDELLWHNAEIRGRLLLHPLVQLYVEHKWKRLAMPSYIRLLLQVFWVLAYTFVLLNFDGTSAETETARFDWEDSEEEATWLLPFQMVAVVATTIGTLLCIVVEIAELATLKKNYFKDKRNFFQLLQLALATCILYAIWPGGGAGWILYAGTIGLFVAYLLLMRDVGKIVGDVGMIVELLTRVLRKTVAVLICCAPLWIAFTLLFLTLFESDYMYHGGGYVGPFVRVLTMMTGEYEYGEAFNSKDDSDTLNTKEQNTTKHTTVGGLNTALKLEARLLLFIGFVIVIPIAFFNLLTGFAVDEIINRKDDLQKAQVAKKVDHINFMESLLIPIARGMSRIRLGQRCLSDHWTPQFNLVKDMATGVVKNSKMTMKFTKSKDILSFNFTKEKVNKNTKTGEGDIWIVEVDEKTLESVTHLLTKTESASTNDSV